jgi:uncharacterized surface protein with fasciclin (FAS1) repeats
MKMLFAAVATVAGLGLGVAVAQDMAPGGDPAKTIAQNVGESPVHTTLASALTAAGLTQTLGESGPFTLLAPPDDVFAALPAGALDEMLKPENKEALKTVLLCHVIDGALVSANLSDMQAAGTAGPEGVVVDTLGGCKLTIAPTDAGGITITDENGTVANVVLPDILQANGVVHVIDAIMKPVGM